MAAKYAEDWKSIEKRLDSSRRETVTADMETHLLYAFIPLDEKRENAFAKLEHELVCILADARELNAVMGTSKAIFTRDWLDATGDFAMRFDHEVMQNENHGPFATKVLFTISPLVIKHGNADGHHHGSQLVLRKAKVALVPALLGKENDEDGDDEDIDMDSDDKSDGDPGADFDDRYDESVERYDDQVDLVGEVVNLVYRSEAREKSHRAIERVACDQNTGDLDAVAPESNRGVEALNSEEQMPRHGTPEPKIEEDTQLEAGEDIEMGVDEDPQLEVGEDTEMEDQDDIAPGPPGESQSEISVASQNQNHEVFQLGHLEGVQMMNYEGAQMRSGDHAETQDDDARSQLLAEHMATQRTE